MNINERKFCPFDFVLLGNKRGPWLILVNRGRLLFFAGPDLAESSPRAARRAQQEQLRIGLNKK